MDWENRGAGCKCVLSIDMRLQRTLMGAVSSKGVSRDCVGACGGEEVTP